MPEPAAEPQPPTPQAAGGPDYDGPLATLADFQAAAERIRAVALQTPLLALGDGRWVKPECLQPTGSFKIRGAYNALAQLSATELERGVVTHSSGNHAQAIARAHQPGGTRAVVVMPANAPAAKVDGVRLDGAEIVFVGPHNAERVERAHQLAERDGLLLIPSADHLDVIAGGGTIGLEIVEQLAELGIAEPPVVLAPVGLGGLAAGVATAVKALAPEAHVLGVEPELAADTRDSLAAGRRLAWPAELTARTIADGLRGEAPTARPFAHLRAHLDGVVTVAEAEIGRAMAALASATRLVAEPSGAVAPAALLFRAPELPSGPVVAVVSGGNVDRAGYVELLSAG
ncbi:MAG TPA: threonine/serine dehydratase [Candidatus Limnocylindria bacterium]|nr:threonine/serine dehydratase [Candidatus Limnocylindria bacterium]